MYRGVHIDRRALPVAEAAEVDEAGFVAPRGPTEELVAHLWADVLGLAHRVYHSRDVGAMPILADALQEAGCENEDVLNHCRGPGSHVRGCWVVDLVLEK